MSELELENVSVRAGSRDLLSEVSLCIDRAELVALVGPNGAGKTTLLRGALGLVLPSRGRFLLGGRAPQTLSGRERAARIAWLPQHVVTSEAERVLDVVAAARFRFDEARAPSERAAARALERVGMHAHAQARITELSGGERQRVRIAALLAQEAGLLLLDEPANHLDPAQQLDIYRLLAELWAGGLGILLVTHDVNLLLTLGNARDVRVVGLANGQKSFETRFDSPALPALLGRLFEVPFEAFANGDQRVILPASSRPNAALP